MSAFVIHTVPGSPYARAVAATLEEKNAEWRVTGLRPGALRSPAHLSLHAFGRMPVLEHGDFVLYETQAILRYVDRVIEHPALTPGEVRAAARMDQLMNINDWYLFQGCGNVIVWNRVVGPKVIGLVPDEQAIAAAMPRARIVIGELARVLADQPYFAGPQLSLADLLIAPQLDLFAAAPEWSELTAAAPTLVRWLDRMRERRSMQRTTWAEVAAKAA